MRMSMFLVFCVFALLVCDVNADSSLEIREIKYSDMNTPEFKGKKLVLLLYDDNSCPGCDGVSQELASAGKSLKSPDVVVGTVNFHTDRIARNEFIQFIPKLPVIVYLNTETMKIEGSYDGEVTSEGISKWISDTVVHNRLRKIPKDHIHNLGKSHKRDPYKVNAGMAEDLTEEQKEALMKNMRTKKISRKEKYATGPFQKIMMFVIASLGLVVLAFVFRREFAQCSPIAPPPHASFD